MLCVGDNITDICVCVCVCVCGGGGGDCVCVFFFGGGQMFWQNFCLMLLYKLLFYNYIKTCKGVFLNWGGGGACERPAFKIFQNPRSPYKKSVRFKCI